MSTLIDSIELVRGNRGGVIPIYPLSSSGCNSDDERLKSVIRGPSRYGLLSSSSMRNVEVSISFELLRLKNSHVTTSTPPSLRMLIGHRNCRRRLRINGMRQDFHRRAIAIPLGQYRSTIATRVLSVFRTVRKERKQTTARILLV
jgi:hypothetical protein